MSIDPEAFSLALKLQKEMDVIMEELNKFSLNAEDKFKLAPLIVEFGRKTSIICLEAIKK